MTFSFHLVDKKLLYCRWPGKKIGMLLFVWAKKKRASSVVVELGRVRKQGPPQLRAKGLSQEENTEPLWLSRCIYTFRFHRNDQARHRKIGPTVGKGRRAVTRDGKCLPTHVWSSWRGWKKKAEKSAKNQFTISDNKSSGRKTDWEKLHCEHVGSLSYCLERKKY